MKWCIKGERAAVALILCASERWFCLLQDLFVSLLEPALCER